MKTPLVYVLLLLSSLLPGYGQESGSGRVLLYGRVTNNWTGEGISGVSVYIESLKRGTTTDETGHYELSLEPGTYTIRFSRVGLRTEIRSVDLVKNVGLDLQLREDVFNLEEISVYSDRADANVVAPDVGKNTLSSKVLTSIPAFLGEVDVVRSLMFLPGVSTVGEGASGFNVRGGGVDQNLILQDGGLIFNSSHVFGFFSTFNPVMVNKATLYKSALPARFGGRLSSVLDVDLKDGSFDKFAVSGGLGLVSSKLAVEGPILKNKLSFIAATRVSYSDWLLRLAENPDVRNSSAAFQDFNGKLSYRLNSNNKIDYSGYYSNDRFALASDTSFAWQNLNHVLRWTHTFSEAIVLESDLVSGSYDYQIEDEEGLNSFTIASELDYVSGKAHLDWNAGAHQINAGVDVIDYRFKPGTRLPGDASGVKPLLLEHERSTEFGAYLEDELAASERISLRAGIRFSLFRNTGPGSDYLYGPDGPRNADNITDTVYYEKGTPIATYNGLEPRLSISYKLSAGSSVKASYNRSRQYLHLITNTAAVTPVDLWKTSNRYIRPETGDQYSLGYFRNLKDNGIETSAEVYYKTAEDIVDFKDGTALLMNENIESALINGTSRAYGAELFLNKKTGRLTGWMSYTFSRILRTVDGDFAEERINNGNEYPANNDKPHAFNVAMSYKKNPVVEFGANFTYSTGRPATVPRALYDVSNQSNVFSFSARNDGRIPDYHRLDLSMTVNSKPKVDRTWNVSWTLAIYNFYGRRNAFSVYYENLYGAPPRAYRLSVLGSAFPSLMINFEF